MNTTWVGCGRRGGGWARRACTAAAAAATVMSAGAASASPAPSPHSVPPSAPKPTSTAVSPDVPDPHPPAGGIGPYGQLVGGARLHSRGLVLPPHAKPLPRPLTATSWILVDLDLGDVLAARDPHGRYQPASILKILTTITLLPRLPGRRVVVAGADAATAEGSAVGLVAGGRYTVDQLFTSLLLMSGNDAATALADAAGGVARTVRLMNETALELGGYDTFVQTPSGLDGWQQLTSAYDMALFLRAAVNIPRFIAYDRQPTGRLPAQRVGGHKYGSIWLGNQNENFLTEVPGALVAKTGFTDAASHTYLCAARRGGRRLGVIFLRARRWPLDQWQQAAGLLNWGYSLPAGTAVGHLDAAAPRRPADRTSPPSASPAPPSSARGSAGSTHGAAPGTDSNGSGPGPPDFVPPLAIALLAVVAAASGGWLTWRRRAHRR